MVTHSCARHGRGERSERARVATRHSAPLLGKALVMALVAAACTTFNDPPGLGGGGTSGNSGASGASGASGNSGSGGAQAWWAYTNEHGCRSVGVPSPDDKPASEDDGASLPPLSFAYSRVRFGSANDDATLTPNKDAWLDIGFDFDKLCTRSGDCAVDGALVDERACVTGSPVTPYDGHQCRDNQVGKMFSIAAQSPISGQFFGISEPDWNCELHRGGFSLLYKISNYNGKANDRQVRVDIYESPGLVTPATYTCRVADSGPSITGTLRSDWPSMPLWQPSDRWRVAVTSIVSNAEPTAGEELPNSKVNTQTAYVRDGYLFAKLPPSAAVGLLGGVGTTLPGFETVLDRGIVVARLAFDDQAQTWSMKDGMIAGVADADKMLQSYRRLGFCENMCSSYTSLVQYLNNARDAMIQDGTVESSVVCDGLTYAMAFEARQATANKSDVVAVPDQTECPDPAHPDAPRANFVCN